MKWQCTLLQRWLPEYPDGDLPGFWRRRLQTHLEHCADCRREAAVLSEMVESVQAAPVADPGPEFWSAFSREMHLKLVQAAQEGQMAPARSPWLRRLPYLVGAPALAGLLLWVAIGYLNPERPGLAPTAEIAKEAPATVAAPAARMANEKGAATEKMAATPAPGKVFQNPEEPAQTFSYAARNGSGEGVATDDDLDDLDSTLAGMTEAEKEAFLKKLGQHQKDGSCVQSCSIIALA